MNDLNTHFFKVSGTKLMPCAGHVLIAEPFLSDDCFNHGVVSLIDYLPEEGTTGVVLNNRTEYMLPELLDGIDPAVSIPVFCGGPLGQDRLYFIHTLGSDVIPNARRYTGGLYIGGDFDSAIKYVNQGYPTEGCIRFFIGYSSWAEGQLEREIMDERWVNMLYPPSPEEILTGAGDRFWHRFVGYLGDSYRAWNLLPRNAVCN